MASGRRDGRMASLLALAAYMTFSSALIIFNKHLMVDDGFGFPLFLTGAGQIMSVLLGDSLSLPPPPGALVAVPLDHSHVMHS